LVDPESTDDAPTPTNGRDASGRFASGNRLSRGRPRVSFTRELQRQVWMPDLVKRLLEIATDPSTNKREALQAIQLAASYTDGKPVGRSLHLSASARYLPPGSEYMNAAQLDDTIDDLEHKALTGEITLEHDGEDED
jgi:hypothetical protein